MIGFTVVDWAAWAPGLQEPAAWRAWASRAWLPLGDEAPPLLEVPAMQRRRIDRLGRMAVQAAWWCSQADATNTPLIFASRHGDARRSLELLEQLVSGEPMSPTQFGLSVHNAIAALYSIVRGARGNYLAIAAGGATVEAALVEAVGLLADGSPEVLVVVYDGPLPAAYADYADEPTAFYAWSWRVRAAGEGTRLTLDWQPSVAEDGTPEVAVQDGGHTLTLPAGLDTLRFFLAKEDVREHSNDGLRWIWRRHV